MPWHRNRPKRPWHRHRPKRPWHWPKKPRQRHRPKRPWHRPWPKRLWHWPRRSWNSRRWNWLHDVTDKSSIVSVFSLAQRVAEGNDRKFWNADKALKLAAPSNTLGTHTHTQPLGLQFSRARAKSLGGERENVLEEMAQKLAASFDTHNRSLPLQFAFSLKAISMGTVEDAGTEEGYATDVSFVGSLSPSLS